MAEEMFSRADLEYIYRDVFGHEGAAKKDVDKLMAKLPAKFTLAQLRGAVGGAGFGDKATRRFGQVVGYMDDAIAAPPPAAAPPPPPPQTAPGPAPRIDDRASDRPGDKIKISDYMPGAGPVGDYLTNLFLGNTQPRGGTVSASGMMARPPDWQPPKGAAQSSYNPNTVPGLKWTGKQWEEVTSGADLTYDGKTGKYFYKGDEVPANQQADMYKYGPGMGKAAPSLANDMIDLSDPRVRAMFGGGGMGSYGANLPPGMFMTMDSGLRGGIGGGGAAPWENAPFAAPPSFAENYIQKLLTNYRPSGPSQLEQQISNMTARGAQGLTPAASQFEGMLANFAQNPYLQSLASGQIPQVMQDALNNQLSLSQANTLEGMGAGQGQLSSDLAQYLNRTESDARTQFLANMAGQAADVQSMLANIANAGGGLYNQRSGIGAQLLPNLLSTGVQAEQARRGNDLQYLLGLTSPLLQTQTGLNENALNRFLSTAENQANRGFNRGENALGRYFGLGNTLLGGEMGQRNNALNMMFQDYGRGSGLPPEIQALLGLAGLGGGTTKTTGSQTQSGGGLQDLMGALGGLGGLAIGGGMMGMGPLGGILGSGTKQTTGSALGGILGGGSLF